MNNFKKILIANRGEIALRIIRTCKELDIKTVAVYSTADKNSLHVKFADEAVCIGPPSSTESYLNISNIIAAAELTNVDAVHPGYGFLSENANFAKICKEHNIKFIGPDVDSIKKMGDKSTAIKTMKQAGIPTVPGSKGIIENYEQALKISEDITYPLLLKAAAGGGGKGINLVNNSSELKKAWENSKREAKACFNNDDIYIEKYLQNPRHIEIQVLGDNYGNFIHLSERDCSIQRRHQKLIEETPSPYITDAVRKKMGEISIRACKFLNYQGAGTIEFLVDQNKEFYFMEMNTRIQVEHPITEQVTSIDLIKKQIEIAQNKKIENKNFFPQKFSIECRINAEDPYNNFRPSPGKINYLNIPGGLGVRVDTFIYQGYTIQPFYDSMIAKLIVTDSSRRGAIRKMIRALKEFVIEGIKTTIPLHLRLLNNTNFIEGNYSTNFIEKEDLTSCL